MMEDVESEDPSLDFLSPSFDPLKVLHTPPNRLRLPHPSVQPCDNLQAYTSGRLVIVIRKGDMTVVNVSVQWCRGHDKNHGFL